MKLLVSGSTVTMKRLLPKHPERLGILCTPSGNHREWWPAWATVGADNDCFQGLNAPMYLRMLAKVSGFKNLPAWVSAPDVVGDSAETLRMFRIWAPVLSELGLPAALVSQDGLQDVPWNGIACLFVGGSTAWKLSDESLRLTLEAHERGKWVHFGRVNSFRRIVFLARAMRDGRAHCDTIDGGSGSMWGDTNLPKLIRWIDRAVNCKQQVAFGGVA